MSTIELFKSGESTDTDLEDYKKNLKKHRLRVIGLWGGIAGAVIQIGRASCRERVFRAV